MLFYSLSTFAWGCALYFPDGTSAHMEFDDETNEFLYGQVFDVYGDPVGPISWADPDACLASE